MPGHGFTIRMGVAPVAAAMATATISQSSTYIGSSTMNQTATSAQKSHTDTQSTTYVDERLLDAKLEAVEARTETKFAQLFGELRAITINMAALDAKIGGLETKIGDVDKHTRNVKSTVIGTIIGTGIAVAALAWGGVQIYQGGMGTSADAFQAGMSAAEIGRNDNSSRSPTDGQTKQIHQGTPRRP